MKIKRTFKEISTKNGQEEILDKDQFFIATKNVEIFKGCSDEARAEGYGALGYGNSLEAWMWMEHGHGHTVQTFFSIYEPAII